MRSTFCGKSGRLLRIHEHDASGVFHMRTSKKPTECPRWALFLREMRDVRSGLCCRRKVRSQGKIRRRGERLC